MPLSKGPELTQYLPPGLVAEATKRLKETLLVAVKNPELSLLELFTAFAIQELNFRENVTPVGEAEVTRLDQLTRDLREQIDETTRSFGTLAARVDNQDLLTARDKFREETAALQQRLDEAKTVGEKTQEVVGALTEDAKLGKVIRDSLAKLEKKGANLPAIVAGALLRSLFEPEERTTIERTAATDADFITASRQAVVASTSRRAEFALSGQTETVVKIPRVQRVKTPPIKARLGVKYLLETEGVDTSSFSSMELAHIAKALPAATRKIFNVDPTEKNMIEALLAIAKQEANLDQFGAAASLRKLHDLGGQTSGMPPATISKVMVTEGTKPPDKPDELEIDIKQEIGRRFLVREDTPLAAVFNFKKDGRWDAGNWGRLAYHAEGTPRTYDNVGRESRARLKGKMGAGLPAQIDLLLTKCESLGINTVSQLAAADAIKMPDEMRNFLTELITPTADRQSGDLPVDVLAKITQIINIPDGVSTKPRNKDDLLKFLRRQKR